MRREPVDRDPVRPETEAEPEPSGLRWDPGCGDGRNRGIGARPTGNVGDVAWGCGAMPQVSQ